MKTAYRRNARPLYVAFVACAMAALLTLAGCGRDAPELVQQARQMRDKGDRANAIIALKNALQADPRNGEARFLLGLIYNESREGLSAEKELRRALELGVIEGGRVHAELARAMFLQGNYRGLLRDVNPAESFETDVLASVLALRGRAHFVLRALAEARQSLAAAEKASARNADAMILAALIKLAERDAAGGRALIEKGIEAHPRNVDLWIMKADLLRSEQKNDEALAVYQKLLEIDPRLVPVRVALGGLYLHMGKKAEAQREVDEARKLSRYSAAVYYLQALIQFDAGKYRDALASVQVVLKVAPEHGPALLLTGTIHHALGAFAQAERALTQFLQANPRNLYARKLLASTLLEMRDGKRALEVIAPAVGQELQDGVLAALAGEAHMQTGEFTRATEFMERAAALDPKNPAIRARLGLSHLSAGDQDRAIAELEAAAKIDSSFRADYTLVVTLLHARDFDKALEAIAVLEKKLPNNPIPHQLRGVAYVGKGDGAAARKQFERALGIDGKYFPAAAGLAELDLKDGNVEAARKRYEGIVAKDPKSVPAMMAIARILDASRDPAGAVKWVRQAVRANPTLAPVQVELVNRLLAIGERKEALSAAQEAIRALPNHPDVLDALGMAQLGNGEANGALATFQQAMVANPGSARAHYRVALVRLMLNDQKGAEEILRGALKVAPGDRQILSTLGSLQLNAGRAAEAMSSARELQKQHPKSGDGLALEGDVLMSQKKYPAALKSYEAALKLTPGGDLVVKAYAAEVRGGSQATARKRLESWVEAHPDDLKPRGILADSYLQSGDHAAAIRHYEYFAQRRPDDLMVQNNLANAYHMAKDRRALAVAERNYKLRPENPLIADTLAWILFENGDTAKSLQLLEKAAAAAPDMATIRYHLAAVLAKSGDRARARREIEKLLASGKPFPEQAQAKALLGTL